MPTVPIDQSAIGVDLSPRFIQSNAVAASPSAATETTICTLTIPSNLSVVSGVILLGFAAFTVGTNGTACNLKIRQTNTSGTTLGATGATTGGITAANLVDMNVAGFDTAAGGSQVYVLTLTVTGGSATSTVSAAQLVAIVV
jgi:hypothetical protein